MLWTVRLSFTSFDAAAQARLGRSRAVQPLFTNDRFLISAENIAIFGVLFISGCLIIGFLLAVFIDQNVRGEGSSAPSFSIPSPCRSSSPASPGNGSSTRPRPAEARAGPWLSELHLRLARQPGHGDLHHCHRRAVAWLRPDHGDPARRACAAWTRTFGRPQRSTASPPGGFIPSIVLPLLRPDDRHGDGAARRPAS